MTINAATSNAATSNAATSNAAGPKGPPIGFLLRRLDGLINEQFDRTLGADDITRRQWQLLNVLRDGDRTLEDLTAAVAPFLDRGAGETVVGHLEPLVSRGFVEARGDRYVLTDAGRELLARLRTAVGAIRERTMLGLADCEYQRTLDTLQTMICNLEQT